MSKTLNDTKLEGNSKTIFIVDEKSSLYFWNDFLTPSAQLSKHNDFFFESDYDLMGNPKKTFFSRKPFLPTRKK